MYKFVKVLGHVITWCICAVTIDEILWALSYCTCSKIIYKKLDIDIPVVGSIGYTIAYVVYALVLFTILMILKETGIIPFANNFDTKLIDSITQYFNNLIINFTNQIVEVLKVSN